MVVNYYNVKNCKYEVYENRPALFPPEDTEESLLREYGFVKMIDGKWFKFLSGNEYQHIMEMYPCDVTFDISYNPINYTKIENKGNNRISNMLSILSLVCFAVVVERFLAAALTPVCVFFGFAIALVTAARIVEPKNIFPKILAIFYITVVVVFTIMIIHAIIVCKREIDACLNSCGGMG
jgi:ABC-type sugar transport system permease subunit